MERKLFTIVLRFLFHLLVRMEVRGLENIPASGGCLICPNHLSTLDPAFAFIYLKRTDATGLVAHKHRKNPFFRWVVRAVNGIWLNREELDMAAVRAAVEHLKAGHILGVAPEGTRSSTHALIQAKTGVAYLADKASVPVIPVAITGTENALRLAKRLRRGTITMTVGKPIYFPPIERKERDAALQRHTDEMMCQIAVMLPPAYRGVYAEHPRLLELLAAQESAAP